MSDCCDDVIDGSQPDTQSSGGGRAVNIPLGDSVDLTCVCLSSQLVGGHPGPGQPSVRPAAEERDHLVPALLLGVNQVSSPGK